MEIFEYKRTTNENVMKKYIFSLVCLCCALMPVWGGQPVENHPRYAELRKSDANIVGHILILLWH